MAHIFSVGTLHSRHRSPFTCVDVKQQCTNCLDELPALFKNTHFLEQRKTLPITKFLLGCRDGGFQDGGFQDGGCQDGGCRC